MLPKHHKTSCFLKAGLFDNLSSFAQLEKRISELPTTVEEGDAFEVFAEAYFFTQKIEQAEEVWPFKSIPSGIKENLSLGTNQKDMGVDGVFKTVSDEFNAYQAKFRTDRKSLTWSEISTFMGLTDNVSQRVLFTNSNDITSVINERTGFHCIRGNDLDRLDENDFETILEWLQSGDVKVEKKTPQPHQDEAIRDILGVLNDEDRATALMACGTGKTLVALWISERMDCQNILVLLPSLTLVRQTLHEWLGETQWQHLSYLCVCSDPTVASKELDSIKVNQSDLDFAVTTESSDVKQFLSQSAKCVKIVFSTYQSAHIVAEGMDNDFRFDLGIFDEAHKTAGREGKKFGFALKDDNLSIKKRLFLTATPRHYNINKRNEDGDLDLFYSMDNPDVYGEIAHTLSFAAAARKDIICNYKVIISVVTSEQVNKEMLKRGEVLINGDVVNAQQIANQIAFKEAVKKYDIRRIFTFHRSVATAKSFTGKGSEGIRTQLPKFNTFHVNGTMSTAMREGIMNEFKDSGSSVISNARCLTEGVDLPAVDMVAFMSPKRSKVDIVQATGRAMRKDPHNPDKSLGYILVPLYLEITTGESVEDAVAKSDFGEVWNVLQALQEQDEVLADIIRQIQEDKGKGDGDGGVSLDPIDILGVDISLKTLQESITAVCIDKLGFTWDMRYGELIKYKECFGDCNVPAGWAENKPLAVWVVNQRTNYRKGLLSEDRIKRLGNIGFEWRLAARSLSWEEMFNELKEYKNKHGNCNVPAGRAENKKLAVWVVNQRANYSKGQLTEDRTKLLEDIGFVWKRKDSQWDPFEAAEWKEMFNALKEYKEKHGNCNIYGSSGKDYLLSRWIKTQRANCIDGKLSNDHIKRLEDIGFEWDRSHVKWEKMFDALQEYEQNHGDCNVHLEWSYKQLHTWVSTQRAYYRNGTLNKNRITRLEKIGFEWSRKSIRLRGDRLHVKWDEMFDALQEYKQNHGDCNVPSRWAENKQLSNWVQSQRTKFHEGIIGDYRFKRLENIGFVWNPTESQWEEMFDALKEYKEKHGDCNDSQHWIDRQLSRWVHTQRARYRNGKLSEDRIKRLEDIGLAWSPTDSYWQEMFDALIEYKKEHGDCNVPSTWTVNKNLAAWVCSQRIRYQKESYNDDRAKQLEGIGFLWTQRKALNEKIWKETFELLKEYKEEYGDCNVPSRWSGNKPLAAWVKTQHTNYQRRNLNDDRIKRLEDIGFEWTFSLEEKWENGWEEMFDVLKEYMNKHGDCNVPGNWIENNIKLGQWVSQQRGRYKKAELSKDCIKRLENIGFEWMPSRKKKGNTKEWKEMFDVLKEYINKHGDCNVPGNWIENNIKLGQWVSQQRGRYKKAELSKDCIERLENIGFEWVSPLRKTEEQIWGEIWKKNFDALKEYKEKHGNCNVSQHWIDRQLYQWVHTQRARYRNGKLSEDRIKRLEDIGFVWSIRKR